MQLSLRLFLFFKCINTFFIFIKFSLKYILKYKHFKINILTNMCVIFP